MEAPNSTIRKRPRSRRSAPVRGLTILALAAWLFPALSMAAAPAERIRGTIDRVIGILKDPAMAGKEKREERRRILRDEIAPVFDFGEMAKRSLGPNWRGRTTEEQDRFVALFREILENSYLGKIESYQGEEIRYGRESIEGAYAEVKTLVVTRQGLEFPVDYRMLEGSGGYRIYDVVIEGISLVGNYRSQFNSILRKSSFRDMMEKLRATIREQRS